MAWFKRGAKDKEKEAEEKAAQEQESENGAEAEAAPAQPPAAQATYRTGRLAGVYLRMYRWVFSVSLNFDSYQLESGVGRFAAGDFPLRGYYNQLFSLFHGQITEEQRELFNDTFSAKALSVALSGGRSVLSELFYANFDRAEEEHTVSEEESPWRWYEFRAERIPDADPQRVQFLLYVRNAAGEGDDGRLPKEAQIPLNQDGSYDWGDIRANRLLNSNDMISYEYDVGQDKLFVHRRRGDKQIDQAEDRFLATLEAKSDWMVFHDSVSDVHTLFKNAMSGLSGSKEIRYRKDGMQGANFVHYKMSAYPLEETGKPTWVFGDLRDVEEQVRQREQDKDILVQMDALLNELYTSMFQVDTNRMVVYRISRTETGFSRSKEAQNLEEKLQGQIRRGVIAPESAKDYLNWLRPGYLQSKTMSGSYEFEARLRLPGTTEYRWYSETITPMDGRPGVFMRLRRDVTETRQLRMTRFEMEQKTRLAEYNGSVLDTMASLVEFRNVETGSHISNVRELTRIFLTDIAMRSPNYEISAHMIDLYAQAATIHDIGKISISDTILNKPGRYTPEEFEIMKTHTTNGARIIERLDMPGLNDIKEICRDVALHHHERYDGRGYPEGLVGDQISIGVQAVSLADVYDALVSVRCYKNEIEYGEALRMILDGECGTFNPRLLETLKAMEPKIRKIYEDQRAPTESEEKSAQALLSESEHNNAQPQEQGEDQPNV